MSGEILGADSIEARITRSERVCFPFWTRTDEVSIWLVLAMFVGMDLALFIADGSTAWFLGMLPFCLLPFGMFWYKRRARIGKELILDESGVHLKDSSSPTTSIDWPGLEGLYRSAGFVLLAKNGSEILMPPTMGGIKWQQKQEEIIDFIVEKSRWIDEKRQLLPKPPPRHILNRRFAWSSVIGTIVFAVFCYYVRHINTGDIDVTEIPYILEWLLTASVVCATASFIAFKAWYQIKLLQHPHLWDSTVPAPRYGLSCKRIQQNLSRAREAYEITPPAEIEAHVMAKTWLTREWAVDISEQQHEVIYDGRGLGYEEVRVDRTVACRTPSSRWFVPQFHFLIGDEHAKLEVKVNLLFRLTACRLTVSGNAVYEEGEI